jgi:S-sulfo-L-cysteine synthase (3-phospho-L-serine-dependent)
MKTILLLYPRPASFLEAMVARDGAALRRRGIQFVLADGWLFPGDRELFHDVIEMPPEDDVRGAHSILARYASEHRIDGVVAQTESALLPGALLIRSLGVPGIAVEAAHLCVNKYRSRVALRSAGVPVPRFALVSDAAGVRKLAAECGYPVVLKAVASCMSRLVTVVRGDRDVDAAVEALRAALPGAPDVRRLLEFASLAGLDLGCDPRREFLVEQQVAGSPIETDGLVVGSQPFTLGVTEQVMTPPPRFYFEGYLFPSDRPAEERARIERISDAAVAASGLSDAGFSIEMRARERDVSVIEVNGRLGQDDGFGEMFRPVTGSEPYVHAIEIAAGLAPRLERRVHEPRAVAYRCSYADGAVAAVPTLEALAALRRDGLEAGISVELGAELRAPPHPEAFPHLAWVLASDPRSSRVAYERARRAADAMEFEITERRL